MRLRWQNSSGRAVSLDTVSRHMTAALRDEGAEVTEDGPADAAILYHYARTRQEGPEGFRDGEDPRVGYALIEATAIAPWMVAALRACDRVWVPSRHSLAGAVASGVPEALVRVVPHGVSPIFGRGYPSDRPSLLALHRDPPLVGWSYAHSWERKNGEAVCRLFCRLAEHDADLRFVVKTLPEQREMIEKTFARMGVPADRTTVIAERWTEVDLAKWYERLAVFVYPTRGGAFELPPLEALACGTPTVIPEDGPCAEYGGGIGFCVPSKGRSPLFSDLVSEQNGQIGDGFNVDEDALYDATLNALNRRPRGNGSKVGACSISARWGWHKAAQKALAALGEPPALGPPSRRLWVWTSGREQCGIREYSDALDDGFRAIGERPLTRPLPDTSWIADVRPGDRALVHYDPGLLEGLARGADTVTGFRAALSRLRRRGARVALCCHYFDGAPLGWPEPDALALHREYGVGDARCEVIPHGAIRYEPDADRGALRRAYGLPEDVFLLSTAGFLAPWKQTPAVLRALGQALARRSDVHVQVLAGRHFSGCHEAEEGALRREAAALGERATVIPGFLPTREILDRLYASDLGFLYHGEHTGSVSGAAKLFVSARCPLVVSGSRHDDDMRVGVVRSEGLDLAAFVGRVVEVVADPARVAALRQAMAAEYEARAMDGIARRYVALLNRAPPGKEEGMDSQQWQDRATRVGDIFVGEVATRAYPAHLAAAGIRRVVSLLDAEEAARWDREMPVPAGVEHRTFHVGEHEAIPPERVDEIVAAVEPGTLVHCISGVNRSQTVAVCRMVRGGMNVSEAMRTFQETRGAAIAKLYKAPTLLSPAMFGSIEAFVRLSARVPGGATPAAPAAPALAAAAETAARAAEALGAAAASAANGLPDDGLRIDPATYYDARYWSAQKPYRVLLPDGSIETRLYTGPALWWDGFGPIADAIVKTTLPGHLLGPEWLDIGCGGGCFVAFLRRLGVEGYGVDISTHAIENAASEAKPFLAVGDVLAKATSADTHPAAGRVYGVVSALDLVEHVYGDDQRALWDAFWRLTRPGGLLVLDVATAHQPEDRWEAEKGAAVPIEREWQAVSGHVFVQPCDYWYGWAAALGWKIDREAMARFQAWRTATPAYKELEAWGERNYMVFRK